jgi:hypothetical protein
MAKLVSMLSAVTITAIVFVSLVPAAYSYANLL